MSSTAMRNRVAATSLALVGALGLSACNGSDTSVTTPSSSSTSSETSSSTTSETSSSSSESSTASETPSSSSETSSSSSSDSSSSAGSDEAVTPKGTTLKFGDEAVVETSGSKFKLKIKSLEVAPDSVYQSANLNKANGTVYYINYDVTPIKAETFNTTSVNGLFLYPTFSSGQKAKRLYGDTDGCKTERKKLNAGETGSACYVYQIDGAKATSVTYNTYNYSVKWQ